MLAVLVLGALASLPWTTHSMFDVRADASMYVITARNIANGEGYSYLGEPFAIRPPGFSLLLAPIIALFGTDFALLNLFVSLSGVLCVALLYGYLRPRLGVLVAFAVAASVWLNPGFQRLCTQVMSDVPGTALMLLCLCLERGARRRPSLRRDLSLGLLIGLSTLVRSMNILLVPAIIAARLTRDSIDRGGLPSLRSGALKQYALLMGLPVLVLGPWSLRNATLELPAPAEQTHLYSYGTGMWHSDPGDPDSPTLSMGEFFGRVPERLRQVLPSLGSRLRQQRADSLPVALGILALLASIVILLRRRSAGEFMVLGQFLLLAIYFAYRKRLVLPLWILAYPAVVEVLLWSATGLLRRRRIAAALTAALVAALGVFDFEYQWRWDAIEQNDRRARDVCSYIEAEVPPTVAIATDLGWELGALLEEHSVYSLRMAGIRDGLPGIQRVLARHAVGVCVFDLTNKIEQRIKRQLSHRTRLIKRFDGWAVMEVMR